MIRLSQTVSCAGCAAKLPPSLLREALKNMPVFDDPNVIVGTNTLDDAGVYRTGDTYLVQTTDFFPPIIDDPRKFGEVAACNALSDVYAMGGKPLTALNILGFPSALSPEILGEILAGAANKVREAGAATVGGHSIRSQELFFGLAVTGVVDGAKILANTAAHDGDALVLTKKIGTGVMTTARKNDKITDDALAEAIAGMTTLNARAAELALRNHAHAATDVTGFSLLGHAMQFAQASKADITFDVSAIPFLAHAHELAAAGVRTGAAARNLEYVKNSVAFGESIDAATRDLLVDPQTSGGLLIAMKRRDAEAFVADHGAPAAIIGTVRTGAGIIYVR